MRVYGVDEFAAAGRDEPGISEWLEVDQARIDRFGSTFEIEGSDRPAAAVQSIVRYIA